MKIPCLITLSEEEQFLFLKKKLLLASLAINFMLPFSSRRIWIHRGFYDYVSLRGFISIIWNDRHMLAMSFIIMFFVIWIGEEIAHGCKKERNAAKEAQAKI